MLPTSVSNLDSSNSSDLFPESSDIYVSLSSSIPFSGYSGSTDGYVLCSNQPGKPQYAFLSHALHHLSHVLHQLSNVHLAQRCPLAQGYAAFFYQLDVRVGNCFHHLAVETPCLLCHQCLKTSFFVHHLGLRIACLPHHLDLSTLCLTFCLLHCLGLRISRPSPIPIPSSRSFLFQAAVLSSPQVSVSVHCACLCRP